MGSALRLQSYLARAGVSSRRGSEKLISEGRVQVNGTAVRELGTKVTPGRDQIAVDGRGVVLEDRALYLFHKPRGVVTTLEDPEGRRTVGDYVERLPERVFPVGRLDQDVSGLLLLTNDGEFANHITHPRYETAKRYLARVRGAPTKETLKTLSSGIMLDDGWGKFLTIERAKTEEAVQFIGSWGKEERVLSIEVTEGRNHFVKRMLAEVGHPVLRLCRIAVGPYTLGGLQRGDIMPVRFRDVN